MSNYFNLRRPMSKLPTSDCIPCCPSAVLNCLMQLTQLMSFESWPIFCRARSRQARSRQARSRQSRLWRRLCVSCFDTSVWSTQLTSCFSHQWSPTPSITVSPVSAGGGPGDLDPLKMCRYLVQRWKVALMSLNALFLPTSLGRCVESYRFDFWEIGLEKHAKSLKINGHEDLKCYMTASEVRKLHKWLVKISQNHPNWISTRISLPVQPVVVGSKAARQAWEQPLALLSRCNTDVQTCKNTPLKEPLSILSRIPLHKKITSCRDVPSQLYPTHVELFQSMLIYVKVANIWLHSVLPKCSTKLFDAANAARVIWVLTHLLQG